MRAVNQRRGTSEYSYLLNELPSLRALHPGRNLTEVYADAIHAYRSARKQEMHLYPGVLEALLRIKGYGVQIIAYTESLGYYSAWRLRELQLDGVVDHLYSPPDHEFPDGVSPQTLRSRPPEKYGLVKTTHRYTPKGILKPDTQILQQIICDAGVSAEETAYVGDSLMKDVAMAQSVGAIDFLAEYGVVQHSNEYDLLRQVSHWSEEDVRRERSISARPHVTPTYVLHRRFDEIFPLLQFG